MVSLRTLQVGYEVCGCWAEVGSWISKSGWQTLMRKRTIDYPRFGCDVAWRRVVGLQLFPEVAYEDAKIFRLLDAGVAPNSRQQCAMRDHALRVPRKIGQYVEFLGRQPHFAALDLDTMGARIYAKVTNFNDIRFWLL